MQVLAERGSGSLDALYRKSRGSSCRSTGGMDADEADEVLLEPRQGSERIASAVEKPGWLGGKN